MDASASGGGATGSVRVSESSCVGCRAMAAECDWAGVGVLYGNRGMTILSYVLFSVTFG